MIRTQVYITEEQAQDIKLKARRENKREAEVIRDLLRTGLNASRRTHHETTGEALLEDELAEVAVCNNENPLLVSGNGKPIFIGKPMHGGSCGR
jgi:hypothetical protein